MGPFLFSLQKFRSSELQFSKHPDFAKRRRRNLRTTMPSDTKLGFIFINIAALMFGLFFMIIAIVVKSRGGMEDFSRPMNIVAVCVCIIILTLLGCFGVLRNNTVMITVYVCLMAELFVIDFISILSFRPNYGGKTNCTLTKTIGVTLLPGFILLTVSLLQFCGLAAFKLRERVSKCMH